MAYEKKVWKNRIVEKPMTFLPVANMDGTITLQPKEGKITEEGEPVDAENMNRIEQGIAEAHDKLTELFQSASNSKIAIAGVIGGVTEKNSFQEIANYINAQKTTFATNLTDKQVVANPTENLSSLVDKVKLIKTGGKFAAGSIALNIPYVQNSWFEPVLEVKTLTFKPKIVLLSIPVLWYSHQGSSPMVLQYLNFIISDGCVTDSAAFNLCLSPGGKSYLVMAFNLGAMTDKGFVINCSFNAYLSSYIQAQKATIEWTAIG